MTSKIARRKFLAGLSGAAAWPIAARAQQAKVHRIGVLLLRFATTASFRTELREELRKLGYLGGSNVLFEFRSAEEQIDRLPALAAELVADRVDVIVALFTPCALAAKQATQQIPIVFLAGDAVA